MILSVSNISKAFQEVPVLSGISFHIEDNEKAAIVGVNGAGKTTLLRIITKELVPDDGVVALSKDKTLGYLAQNQNVSSEKTIYEELLSCLEELLSKERSLRQMEEEMNHLSGTALDALMDRYMSASHSFELAGGYTYQSELTGILKGLGFQEEDFDKRISTLSGGQKTRVALGKLLLNKPDLIILDEPTNHLDILSIEWLEGYLKNYKGAVLIVSHDRFFLDRITEKIIEIERCGSTVFSGNYSDYAKKKALLRNAEIKAYQNQQAMIAHEKAVIDKLKSFNREKSIKRAESREKMLDKVEVLDKPTEEKTDMKLTLEPECISGKDVLNAKDLSKHYGNLTLFTNQTIDIKRGEHVAIIGSNGTGKTTLLKILNGIESADSGTFQLGSNVTIGYYDQEHHVLHDDKTLFDEISDAYPDLSNTKIRNTLAAFLFTGEDAFKKISALSGGEKGRVSLAKLMLSKANFLILDEPTNHLDIISKEILENALNLYTGTVLYVSHDRYFVNKTASRILELSNQSFTSYLGNYDYYLSKKETSLEPISSNVINDTIVSLPKEVSIGALDYKAQKEEAARERKKQNEIKKCEDEIETLEAQIADVDAKLNDSSLGNNLPKLQELSKEKETISARLSELYEKWELLSSE